MDSTRPVVTEKPMRVREMKTKVMPTDMLDTMRLVSAKKTLIGENITPELQKQREGKPEIYHEGYVDGKLYLVPDSNLEAMKDMINFKMRPRKSVRYKHQTSYEISDYDHFRGRIGTLLDKIDKIQKFSSESEIEPEPVKKEEPEPITEESSESEEEPEPVKEESSESEEEPEPVKEESSVSEEEPEPVKEESSEPETVTSTTSEEKSSAVEEEKVSEAKEEPVKEETAEESTESESVEPEIIPIQTPDPNEYRLRFLVSGHFKNNQEPVYIIQEYDGSPDLFKGQKADFFSSQKEGNVDFFISGKFYNENILEEFQGKPIALNTKPNKIVIDEEKSKVYDDYFEDIYNMTIADVVLKGEFVKSKITTKITPFLTIGVKQKPPTNPNKPDKVNPIYNNTTPTTVLVYKPKYHNPFLKDEEYNKNEDECSKNTNSDTLHSSSSTVALQSSTSLNPSQSIRSTHSLSVVEVSPSETGMELSKTEEKFHKPLKKTVMFEIHESPRNNFKEGVDNNSSINKDYKAQSDVNNKSNTIRGEGFFKMIKDIPLFKSIFTKRNTEGSSAKNEKLQQKRTKTHEITIIKNQQLNEKKEKESWLFPKSEKATEKKIKKSNNTPILATKRTTNK